MPSACEPTGRGCISSSSRQICSHDIDVFHAIASANVIDMSDLTALKHCADRSAMISDEQPVALVQSIAVNRQRSSLNRVQNHQRNQLLRKLIRAVVVAAARGDRRQRVRLVIRAHQMIGRGLGGRIRTVRRVRRLFVERRIVGPSDPKTSSVDTWTKRKAARSASPASANARARPRAA